jgi:hypothetical protein
MQQAAENARFLAAGKAARRLNTSRTTLRRTARRGAIIPIMRAPGGFACCARANVAADAARPRCGGIGAGGGC